MYPWIPDLMQGGRNDFSLSVLDVPCLALSLLVFMQLIVLTCFCRDQSIPISDVPFLDRFIVICHQHEKHSDANHATSNHLECFSVSS